jgi:hypothetical protein
VSASRLQKERDRILATPPDERNFKEELNTLNAIVLEETKNFFWRVLDCKIKPDETSTSSN